MAAERLTQDEVLKMIADRDAAAQKENKNYVFRIRVLRKGDRVGLHSIGPNAPTHIATFDDAEVRHILAPEQWLPQFAGGGKYALDVRTAENQTGFGSYIECHFEGAAPRDPGALNFEALKLRDWPGPRACVYPQPSERPPVAPVIPISAVAPLPGTLNGGAPPTHSPGANPATVPPPQVDVNAVMQNFAERFELRIAQMQANTDLREREREIRAEADRRIAEAKEEARRAIAESKAAQGPAVQHVGPTTTEIVTGMLTAAAPIVKMWVDSQNERDRERREEQRREEERRREDDRRRDEQRREDLKRADEDRRLFLDRLLARPEISPEVKAMMDKMQEMFKLVQEGQQSPSEAAQQIMQLTGSVTQMGLQLIQQAQHAMSGGEPDSPWVKVAEHVSNAVQAMIPAQQNVPRLPPRTSGQRPESQPAQRNVPYAAPAPSATPIIDKIEQMIRNMEDADAIAKYLMDNFESEEITKALTDNKGDLVAIMMPRLEKWVGEKLGERQSYIMTLFEAIDRAYKAAGHEHAGDDVDADEEGEVVESTGTPVPAS